MPFLGKVTVFFVVILLLGCGSGGGGGDESNNQEDTSSQDEIVDPSDLEFESYKDTINNVYFRYPNNWSSDTNDNIIIAFLSPQDGSDDVYLENFSIYFTDIKDDDGDDDDDDEESNISDITIIESESTIINGMSAWKYVFDAVWTESGFELRILQIVIEIGDRVCVINYAAERSNYENYLYVAEVMIDSVRIGATIAEDLDDAGSNTDEPGRPAIGYDGDRYLVLTYKYPPTGSYDTPIELIGVFVKNDRTVSSPFTVHQFNTNSVIYPPAIKFDGNNYMAVFIDTSELYSGATRHVYGVRITPEGEVLDSDTPIMISEEDQTGLYPEIEFNGENYLVAYTAPGSFEALYSYYKGVFGATLSPDGEVLSRFTIYDEDGIHSKYQKLSTDGNGFIAIWENSENETDLEIDLMGTHITEDGTVLDPGGVTIANGIGAQSNVVISYDGDSYLVSWLDIQDDGNHIYPKPSSIFSRRVASSDEFLTAEEPSIPEIIVNDTSDAKQELSQSFDGLDHFIVWRTGSYNNSPPSGLFGMWISPDGVLSEIADETFGSNFTGPPPDNTKLVHPTVLFGDTDGLLIWVNNSEISYSTKSIHAIFINMDDTF